MSRRCRIGRLGFVWMALLLATMPAAAQEENRPATLVVRLPADARLTVDGRDTKQTGAVRRFYSPPLEAGKQYHYTFQWAYQKDGKTITRKKVVHVRSGEQNLDLSGDDAGELVASEKKPEKPENKKKDDETNRKKEPAKTTKGNVEYVPTPQDVVDKMLDLAEVAKDDVVYDLGCGDGRVLITAAKKYRCKAVGFDLDEKRLKEARDNAKSNDVTDLVTVEKKDIFKVDLRPANVVTMYLLPELNEKLLPQLEKMKPGSRIVSHDFDLKGYKAKQKMMIESKEDNRSHTIYLFVTPLEKK